MKAMFQTLLVAITFCGCAMDANEETEAQEVQAAESEVKAPYTCADLETNCDRMGGSYSEHSIPGPYPGQTMGVSGTCEYPNGQTSSCTRIGGTPE